MSTSSPKSNSSASARKNTTRKATPRPKATKASKAPKASAQKAKKTSKNKASLRSLTTGSKKAARTSTRRGATARTSLNSASVQGRGSSSRARTAPVSSSARSTSATDKRTTINSGSIERAGRIGFIVAVTVGALAVVGLTLLLILSHLPVFVVEGIDAVASEHVTAETIAKLANVESGTTLLSVDVGQIQENVKRNPWVKDVHVSREFPTTLGISIEERPVGAIVVIGAGTSVWALGSDGIWIEPVQLDTSGVDVATAALTRAQELNCLLITDVPASVDPAQGSATTDETILACLNYQEELASDIASQVRVYYASSVGSISMVLDSGLEVSLGSPEDINSKSLALTEIMATYPNQLTYVNVRVATKPTYRKVPDGTSLSSVNEVLAANIAATADTADASTDSAADGDDADSSDDSDASSDESQDSSEASSDDSYDE